MHDSRNAPIPGHSPLCGPLLLALQLVLIAGCGSTGAEHPADAAVAPPITGDAAVGKSDGAVREAGASLRDASGAAPDARGATSNSNVETGVTSTVDPAAPASIPGTLLDPRDGVTYRTVTVNGLVWMSENLRYAPTTSSYKLGSGNYYCDNWCYTLGAYYTVSAAPVACPDGWRLPTEGEFQALFDALSPDPMRAADKLRAKSWQGSDVVGFSAILSGWYLETSGRDSGPLLTTGEAEYWTSSPSSAGPVGNGGMPAVAVIDLEHGAWLWNETVASEPRSIRCVQPAANSAPATAPARVANDGHFATKDAGASVPLVRPEPWTGPIPSSWPAWCSETDPSDAASASIPGAPGVGHCGAITDPRDGKAYRWTRFDSSIYLAENLAFETPWGSYCYADDPANCAKYGRLYEFAVAQAVCPSGWRLPDANEAERFTDSAMRATDGWASIGDPRGDSPGNGTDSFGFTQLAAGGRWPANGGYFAGLGYYGESWSTPTGMGVSWKHDALSVRCLWDPEAAPQRLPAASPIPPGIIPRYCATEGHCGYLTDARDGKTYRWTHIGTQVWMAENLNYGLESSRCYQGTPENCSAYGGLYTLVQAQESCPEGWHLPSLDEWKTLASVVGRARSWKDDSWPWSPGNDAFGFSARGVMGPEFHQIESYSAVLWWSTDVSDTGDVTTPGIYDDGDALTYDRERPTSVAAVRCVQN